MRHRAANFQPRGLTRAARHLSGAPAGAAGEAAAYALATADSRPACFTKHPYSWGGRMKSLAFLVGSIVGVWFLPALGATSGLWIAIVGLAALLVLIGLLQVPPFLIAYTSVISAQGVYVTAPGEEPDPVLDKIAEEESERVEERLATHQERVTAPALAWSFLAFWTLVFLLIWSLDSTACPADPTKSCHGSFLGLGTGPHIRDFLYMAVNGVVANIPPDAIAHSRLAHLAVTLEMITAATLLVVRGATYVMRLGSDRPERA
jgi:hypothetical protein